MDFGSSADFFLFGMGDRSKYIYKHGVLYSWHEYTAVRSFAVIGEVIDPAEYTVSLTTDTGEVVLYENERGFFIRNADGSEDCLADAPISLPDFTGHPYRDALRILHHEICINIVDGKPVPNFFVYPKPWYRDGAMMAMVLEKTGNLDLIKPWVSGLTELYDRNNKGNEESDNLGQLLYLMAVTGNGDHPLVKSAVDEALRRLSDGVLTGTTDYNFHPVYQTKWLKFGMEALGMDTGFLRIPDTEDSYAELFWMDGHLGKDDGGEYDDLYPYLSWAKAHSCRQPIPEEYCRICYPMSHETMASEADYEKLRPLFPDLADARCAAPHTWHAAEMFLYLITMKGGK